jgi:hypothetical protein
MDNWTDQQRAAHAKQLLDDPMIGEFFMQAREQLFSSWVIEDDWSCREALWQRAQALDNFRAYLHGFLATGQLLTHAEQGHE